MRVTIKKSDVFIPDWDDNLERPEAEQIKFHYRFLGSAERKQYIYTRPMEFTQELGKGDGQFGKMEMVQDGPGLAKRMVSRIENLEVEFEDGKVVQVEDIKEFYKYPLPDLAALVEAHMIEATAVVNSKNSE